MAKGHVNDDLNYAREARYIRRPSTAPPLDYLARMKGDPLAQQQPLDQHQYFSPLNSADDLSIRPRMLHEWSQQDSSTILLPCHDPLSGYAESPPFQHLALHEQRMQPHQQQHQSSHQEQQFIYATHADDNTTCDASSGNVYHPRSAGPYGNATETSSNGKIHRISRPPNAWILYRSDKLVEMKEQNALTRTPQAELSKQIAELWRNESEQVKKSYEALAEQRKKEHDELYPDYKFKPRKRVERGASSSQSSKARPSRVRAATTPSFIVADHGNEGSQSPEMPSSSFVLNVPAGSRLGPISISAPPTSTSWDLRAAPDYVSCNSDSRISSGHWHQQTEWSPQMHAQQLADPYQQPHFATNTSRSIYAPVSRPTTSHSQQYRHQQQRQQQETPSAILDAFDEPASSFSVLVPNYAFPPLVSSATTSNGLVSQQPNLQGQHAFDLQSANSTGYQQWHTEDQSLQPKGLDASTTSAWWPFRNVKVMRDEVNGQKLQDLLVDLSEEAGQEGARLAYGK